MCRVKFAYSFGCSKSFDLIAACCNNILVMLVSVDQSLLGVETRFASNIRFVFATGPNGVPKMLFVKKR